MWPPLPHYGPEFFGKASLPIRHPLRTACPETRMFEPPQSSGVCIENYAFIGDCMTAALVHREGSIDWLCWPRFDSSACFAALLGSREHGRWRLAPSGPARVSRRYLDGTLILVT